MIPTSVKLTNASLECRDEGRILTPSCLDGRLQSVDLPRKRKNISEFQNVIEVPPSWGVNSYLQTHRVAARSKKSLRQSDSRLFLSLVNSELFPQPRHLYYQSDPTADRFGYYENLWKQVSLSLLKKHLPPAGQTVLDYGSGRGESVQLFSDAGYRVTGTDVDPECVKRSQRFGQAVILDPTKPVTQFGAKSFDVVISFHVLEHVENPRQTLSHFAQIARHYIVLAVPNLRYLHSLFARSIDLSRVNEGHLQAWDHWHLRNLAERYCGLELVEWGFDATVLPLISNLSHKILGDKATIWLETGPFKKIFPFHTNSIIALFRVK